MKGYKGFYPGLICEPDFEHKKQYAENTVYEEDKAECCRSGMHFCKYPLDVFRYYPPATDKGVSEYAEIEALDKPVTNDGEKYCSKKLKIGAKIGIPALVQASVEGKDSIALAFGIESKAKGALGCYIVLAEWGEDDEGNRQLKTVECHKVDGKTVKPDTWYTLKNGKFMEVE